MPQKKKQADKVDKRYRAKVVIPGLDKPVWVSAKTKRELEDEKRRVKEEYINGPKREDIPFIDVIREWYDLVKTPRFKKHSTQAEWEMILRKYVYPFFPVKKLCRSVTRRDLQACLDQAAGRAGNYGIVIKSCLQNACRYAVAEGVIQSDPSSLLTRPNAKEAQHKRSLTRKEEENILDAAHAVGGMEETLTLLLYYTGMRISEAAALRWEDVLWRKGLLHIQHGLDTSSRPMKVIPVKSAAGNRYVPLVSPLLTHLKAIRGLPSNFVLSNSDDFCPTPMLEAALNRVMYQCGYVHLTQKGLKEAARREKKGLPQRKTPDYWDGLRADITPHYFRHHFITSCVQADYRPEYIMSIVGHASYTTTIQTYTHIQHLMLEDDFKSTRLSEILFAENKVAKRLPETI